MPSPGAYPQIMTQMKTSSEPTQPLSGRSILLIEDEEDLAHSIKYHFEREGGLTVTSAATGHEGLEAARRKRYDLILLDLMLPDTDGLEVCKRLRAAADTRGTPVVMITARVDEVDKIVGLEVGADDYITKPFSIRELLARVRAHLRREERRVPSEPAFQDDKIRIDFEGHTVWSDGREVTLTRKEFELLSALVRSRGRVLTREKLLEAVWGYQYIGETRTVDVHVFRLRQKLGDDDQTRIETVVGVGYRYRNPAAP